MLVSYQARKVKTFYYRYRSANSLLLTSFSCLYIARVVEEEMFGIENLCWISAKSTLEASQRAEFLILQTGMTAFGKAYYRNQRDLVPNVSFFR